MLDKDQPVAEIQTLESIVSKVISVRRFSTVLLGAFAVLALVLAAVGSFGVMAYSDEIGIRVALGAHHSTVMKLILGHAFRLAAGGVVLGLTASMALTRLLSSFLSDALYEVHSTDPLTCAGVIMLLLAIAVAASYVPARRAMRVDPAVALRNQ
jgi:putative ABC transport system permease protein